MQEEEELFCRHFDKKLLTKKKTTRAHKMKYDFGNYNCLEENNFRPQ